MKRLHILALILCAILLLSALPVFSYAVDEENFIDEIGDLDVPYAVPEIDGIINDDEGWSEGKYFDRTSIDGCWGGEDPRLSGYLYRAWNDEGLCIAADLSIPDMTLSTDLDEPEIDGSIFHGYNGDVFILTFDPEKKMQLVGMGDEFGPWYCMGIFENNEIKVYRTHYGEKEVTSEVTAAGALTENGWRFEICVPWDLIISDIETASMDDVQLKKEELAKGGTECNMHFIYLDRWYDIEMRGIETYSRYASICTTLPDGLPGTISSATTIKTYGIYLHFLSKPGEETAENTVSTETAESTAPETTTVQETEETAEKSAESAGSAAAGGKTSSSQTGTGTSSQAANTAQTTGQTETVEAAQTGDEGIALAGLAAVASSALFIALYKKKRSDRS